MGYFFFGTLMDSDVMEAVIGRPPLASWSRPARLAGYRVVCFHKEPFPVLVAEPGETVAGIIVDWLNAADIERVRFFESVEYAPQPVTVDLDGGGRETALVFADSGAAERSDARWDIGTWRARQKAEHLRLTRLWMALYGRYDIATANRLWDEAVAAGRPLEDLVGTLTDGLSVR
jgi:hypothetical protein